MCVAVSQTSDATGAYNRYSFNYGNQFPDYPKLGVWPDAYYVSSNIFTNGSSWAGAKACAWNRTSMLSGGNGVQVCFQLSTAHGSLLPADLDGPASPPPSGAPGYFVDFGSSALNLWTFHADWATPANSTLTGPTSLPAAAFQQVCNGGTCVPQSGTRQKLDSLGDRLMYRFAYRNLTSTLGHESLVVNQSVNPGDGTSGVRWYELQKAGSGAWTVAQQSTFAPTDSKYRWMGSVAMDKRGDLAVGYSESNSSMFPAVVVNGRPAGSSTLGAEVVVKAGGGSQLPSLSRWGDYSAMTIDPVDDCTFWYTNEYLKTSGTFNWSTWITAFRFPGCT
jgi:hypothetical protein